MLSSVRVVEGKFGLLAGRWMCFPWLSSSRSLNVFPSLFRLIYQCSGGRFQADSRKYQLEPLAWFFARVFDASLSDIGFYRERYKTLQNYQHILHFQFWICFKSRPEKRLKVSDILKEKGLSRRTVQYALKSLSDQKFLQLLGKGAASRYKLVF